jgi:hypothetical protein
MEPAEEPEHLVACFFGGTASSFARRTTQIEGFGLWTSNADKCFFFDGCGVTNGLAGTIWVNQCSFEEGNSLNINRKSNLRR